MALLSDFWDQLRGESSGSSGATPSSGNQFSDMEWLKNATHSPLSLSEQEKAAASGGAGAGGRQRALGSIGDTWFQALHPSTWNIPTDDDFRTNVDAKSKQTRKDIAATRGADRTEGQKAIDDIGDSWYQFFHPSTWGTNRSKQDVRTGEQIVLPGGERVQQRPTETEGRLANAPQAPEKAPEPGLKGSGFLGTPDVKDVLDKIAPNWKAQQIELPLQEHQSGKDKAVQSYYERNIEPIKRFFAGNPDEEAQMREDLGQPVAPVRPMTPYDMTQQVPHKADGTVATNYTPKDHSDEEARKVSAATRIRELTQEEWDDLSSEEQGQARFNAKLVEAIRSDKAAGNHDEIIKLRQMFSIGKEKVAGSIQDWAALRTGFTTKDFEGEREPSFAASEGEKKAVESRNKMLALIESGLSDYFATLGTDEIASTGTTSTDTMNEVLGSGAGSTSDPRLQKLMGLVFTGSTWSNGGTLDSLVQGLTDNGYDPQVFYDTVEQALYDADKKGIQLGDIPNDQVREYLQIPRRKE